MNKGPGDCLPGEALAVKGLRSTPIRAILTPIRAISTPIRAISTPIRAISTPIRAILTLIRHLNADSSFKRGFTLLLCVKRLRSTGVLTLTPT
jgi:hypothetical protein